MLQVVEQQLSLGPIHSADQAQTRVRGRIGRAVHVSVDGHTQRFDKSRGNRHQPVVQHNHELNDGGFGPDRNLPRIGLQGNVALPGRFLPVHPFLPQILQILFDRRASARKTPENAVVGTSSDAPGHIVNLPFLLEVGQGFGRGVDFHPFVRTGQQAGGKVIGLTIEIVPRREMAGADGRRIVIRQGPDDSLGQGEPLDDHRQLAAQDFAALYGLRIVKCVFTRFVPVRVLVQCAPPEQIAIAEPGDVLADQVIKHGPQIALEKSPLERIVGQPLAVSGNELLQQRVGPRNVSGSE